MDWWTIITNPQVQQIAMAIFAAILAWRKRDAIVSAAKSVSGYGSTDNRDDLSAALTLIWDNVEHVKGKACKDAYNDACETLSKCILRPCEKPESEPEPKST